MTSPKKRTPSPLRPQKNHTERYFSRAIGNGLRVLELLNQNHHALTLSEVTQLSRLPKSSAFRILRTLEIAGYIQRLEGDRFALTAGSAGLTTQLPNQILAAARPYMRHLSQEFGETVSLACLFNNHIEVTAVLDSVHRISMGNMVGGIIPPHASSLGKCITAFQLESRAEKLIRSFSLVRFTPNTIVEEAAFSKEMELVRARGYATDFEESTLGGYCLSAPILDKQGAAIAAISVSTPKMRFNKEERLITVLRQAGEALTDELGAH